jgi:glycosyltransferase involved in cell wall biosynthesis
VNLRVALQAWLPDDAASGARTRLLGLLHGLATIDHDVELHLLAGKATSDELVDAARRIAGAAIHRVPIPPWPPWRRVLREQRHLPVLIGQLDIDVLDLQSLPVPRLDRPVVLTVHDLRDFGAYARTWRRVVAPAVMAQALRRAARIVVPSPNVRTELAHRFPRSGDRIDVVPAGIARQAATNGVTRTGFLHVGRPEPRKALPFLLEAYARAARIAPELPELVLVGPGSFDRTRARAERLGIADRVRIAGAIDESGLATEIDHAAALVFPSRLEGFGLPVLEAASRGTPSLVATGGATEWLSGDGGLALPDNPDAWANALVRLHRDHTLRDRLGAAARTRAAGFTTTRSAQRLVDVWQRAASHRRHV